MEVDRADETEGRLPKPGDADACNPEQDYLPPQLSWVERRIEHVQGRDVPRLRRREVEDRPAPPVRRDADAADPEAFDPERAGIDHDSALATADTHDLERKTRNYRVFRGHSESEPPDDAVGVRLDPVAPGSQRCGAEIGLALHQGFVALQERRRIVSRLADRGEAERA